MFLSDISIWQLGPTPVTVSSACCIFLPHNCSWSFLFMRIYYKKVFKKRIIEREWYMHLRHFSKSSKSSLHFVRKANAANLRLSWHLNATKMPGKNVNWLMKDAAFAYRCPSYVESFPRLPDMAEKNSFPSHSRKNSAFHKQCGCNSTDLIVRRTYT